MNLPLAMALITSLAMPGSRANVSTEKRFHYNICEEDAAGFEHPQLFLDRLCNIGGGVFEAGLETHH